MPSSTAISAQGSTLSVSGGAGVVKNITGLALGFPTIVASAAHGFSNGDIVTFGALAGNTTLNGQTAVIKNVTAGTYAVDIDTTGGAAWTAGGTATPVAWTPIGNLNNFKGFDGTANEIDKTNLSSTAKEFMLGLQDFGHFTFDVDKDFTDPGQVACDAAKRAGTLKQFKLTLPNTRTATFSGYVKNSPLDGGVDQILKTTGVSIRITGDVAYA
ncbi:phage tail tube protein [Paraburkholderia sp. BL21I4N1]|uniref:phage tail tube protein n=1 Tax=Paraburkholderia sp. BL21I4N1 TaxID=1938801 RepID=UPI000CFD91BD|nr:phage tail tube protein [Paraburkholderia sp. BL21I4N1]PQV50972.1 tail tube protein [Paraburkholderia sp. BL21I4N1]